MTETHNPANSQKSTAAMQHLPPIQTSTELRSLASKPFSIQFLKYFIRTNLILKHKKFYRLRYHCCAVYFSAILTKDITLCSCYLPIRTPSIPTFTQKLKHENKNNLRTLPHRNILGESTDVELS